MPIPLSAETYLESLEVPGCPNLFVLGSFARHVTIYSQQVRALNLIHSLVRTRRLGPGGRSIAIAGGGAAGITAAGAALLSIGGVNITVVEKGEKAMPLQIGSAKRYVHPHIYDWPEEGSDNNDAGLPIFNWTAGEARTVAARLNETWKNLRLKYDGQLHFESKSEFESLEQVQDRYVISWRRDESSERTQREFHFVFLAMGFGRDADPLHKGEDYWQDSWIDQPRGGNSRWLVSGTGDGGLTDLMRLKISGFRHHEVVKKFSAGRGRSLADVRRELQGIPRGSQLEALSRHYGPALQQILRKMELRTDTRIALNDRFPLRYSAGTLLNRLIVGQLEEAGGFDFLEGDLGEIKKLADGRFSASGADGTFDRILVRHGPQTDLLIGQLEAKLGKDSAILRGCTILQDRWKAWTDTHIAQDDPTRIPCWIDEDLNADRGFKRPAEKARPKEPAATCLVIGGDLTPVNESREPDFVRTVRQAMEQVEGGARVGSQPVTEPFVIRASDSFAVRAEYREVIRLLCEAPIAIVDVTDFEPAVMILLGVRAAVRRGVTITVTRDKDGPDFWRKLPFNIREVNTLSLHHPDHVKSNDPQSPINRLRRAIEDAALQLTVEPQYSDLPGYFELRAPSGGSAVDESRALVLCPFSPAYLNDVYQKFLGPGLETMFKGRFVQMISDLTSPKLVALRLYDAIRRSFFCVVDWTAWKPNVMFELGIRLAASDQLTVGLLWNGFKQPPEDARLWPDRQMLRLRQFFSPIEYDPNSGGGQLSRVKALLDAYEGTSSCDSRLFEIQDRNLTFNEAASAVRTEIDPGLSSVEALLENGAKGLAPDPYQPPDVLFRGARRIQELARAVAKERLIAAWCYVKHWKLHGCTTSK